VLAGSHRLRITPPLATKVFPDSCDASDIYSRLRAQYSYWNAIGLTARWEAIGCMWLGATSNGPCGAQWPCPIRTMG